MARSELQDAPVVWTSETTHNEVLGTIADSLSAEQREAFELFRIENTPVETPDLKGDTPSQAITNETLSGLDLEKSTQPGVQLEAKAEVAPSVVVTPNLGKVAVQTAEPVVERAAKQETTSVVPSPKQKEAIKILAEELENRQKNDKPREVEPKAEANPAHVEATNIPVESKPTKSQEVSVSFERSAEKPKVPKPRASAHANDLHAEPHQKTEPAPHPERMSFFEKFKSFFYIKEDEPEAAAVEVQPVAEPLPIIESKDVPKASTERKKPIKLGEEWGAKDVIKPEDIPEGELTLEQYLAKRPKAQEGDIGYSKDKNGRDIAYELTTGHRVKLAENPRGQFDDTETQRYYKELYKNNSENAAYNEASVENKEYDSRMSERVQASIEGKYIAEEDERLRDLLALGKELDTTSDAKQRIFNDLFTMYRQNGADPRGLQYVQEQVEARVNGETPIEGAAYLNGEKVELLNFFETPESVLQPGQTPADRLRVYAIKTASGETLLKASSDLEFKRDYAKEASITTEAEQALTTEAEPKTRLEKIKRWVSVNAQQWNEFGGLNWLGSKGALAKKFFTERKITPDMTEAEKEVQLNKNRRNNMLGLFAAGLAVGGVAGLAIGLNIHESIDAGSMPTGGLGGGEAAPSASDGISNANVISGSGDTVGREMRDLLDGSGIDSSADIAPVEPVAPVAPVDPGIENSFYDIPKNQGGIKLFSNLGLSEAVWNENAATLATNFPRDFEIVGNDVRITHGGWLSTEAREFIEQIRARQ